MQTSKHGLAENNVLGCELIGNLNDSQWFAIINERLSSRIRLLLFSIFLLTTRMMTCAYSTHKLQHFERDFSIQEREFGTQNDLEKLMIYDMKDA